MHYYKRNLGDYAKKAGRLSMLQHGSYTLLIDACYDREQFPTLEEAIEWTWASTTEEIEAVTFVLKKFFMLEDGRYVQKRIQEEVAEYHGKAETNKRIAIEREAKRKQESTNRAPVVNGPPPNHKPITNNQEPLTKNHKPKKGTTTQPASRPADVPEMVWDEFVEFRRKKGATVSDLVLLTLRGKAGEAGMTLPDAMAHWVTSGHQGFFPPDRKSAQASGETAYQRSMRERIEQINPAIAAKPNGAGRTVDLSCFDAPLQLERA